MMKKSNIVCRHPKVVMIYEHEEDIVGAASIISEQVADYRTLPADRHIRDRLQQFKPSVILFAMNSITDSIELYTKLIDARVIDFIHYSVLMCKNKESSIAFRCCIKNVFDNYFVYQPLYEKFRLKAIVHNGLTITQSNSQYQGLSEEQLEDIDNSLRTLIDSGSSCREQLLNSVANCKSAIEATPTPTPEQVENPEKIIASLKSQHIDPLLADLEEQIKSGLDAMLDQMLTKQLHLKQSHGQTRSQKSTDTQTLNDLLAPTPESKPQKHKILVVEDNHLYREMIVKALQQDRFDTDEASDGITALKKIKANDYSLILMDLFMPNLDGINTTKQIKVVNNGQDIPVIALTSNNNRDLIKRWAQLGLKGYILKPSTKQEIVAAVNTTLN
ncbi:response regulator [Shewanella waksmanii]|uniref:response regulator n=1 Tax=Shewanella waksmanii TaxID=213783 RepID=UPI0037364E8D